MNRRNPVWIALAVGIATVAVLVVAGRLRRRPIAAGTDRAPDAGPHSIGSAATSAGEAMQGQAPSSQAPVATAASTAEPAEQPLPMWVRLTIVGVALLAFMAVSLIATRTF
jgi:hypothetical protein